MPMKSPETKVSKNCYKGSQVTCLDEVNWCRANHLSLYHIKHNRIYPAAVICNWQLGVVDEMIKKGYLYRVLK